MAKEVIDDQGSICVVEEILTDGSRVYNVWLSDKNSGLRAEWQCEDESRALDLADELVNHPSFEIGKAVGKDKP